MCNNLYFCDTNIEDKINEQYDNYLYLFQRSKNFINGKEIYRKRFPDVFGFDKSFFHTITKEYVKQKDCSCPNKLIKCEHPFTYNPLLTEKKPREICPHRLIAVHSLKDFFNKELYIWRKDISIQGFRHRICCYDPKDEYLVVLEERNNGDIYYVTGYPIEYNFKKKKLLKEYQEYIKQNEIIESESKSCS